MKELLRWFYFFTKIFIIFFSHFVFQKFIIFNFPFWCWLFLDDICNRFGVTMFWALILYGLWLRRLYLEATISSAFFNFSTSKFLVVIFVFCRCLLLRGPFSLTTPHAFAWKKQEIKKPFWNCILFLTSISLFFANSTNIKQRKKQPGLVYQHWMFLLPKIYDNFWNLWFHWLCAHLC